MTQEFNVGDKVRYKVGEEEACRCNGHEFGAVYTVKSIGGCARLAVYFEECETVCAKWRLELVESEQPVRDVMTRKQLIEKLQEVATERYENYRDSLYNQWSNCNTMRPFYDWLSNMEKEDLDRYEQEMLQFNQLQ